MDDAKRAYREAENKTKEEWRRTCRRTLDRANAADDIRAGLGNLGDEVDEEVDKTKFRQEHGNDPV